MHLRKRVMSPGGICKFALLALICTVLGSGCAPVNKRVFHWGYYNASYDTALYFHYVKSNPEKYANELQTLIARAEKENLKLGPGLNAEYAFLLYQKGQIDLAKHYFQLEAQNFPESKPFMEQIIARLETKTDETTQEAEVSLDATAPKGNE